MASVHRHAIDFLLAAISTEVGEDGMFHTFPIDRSRASVGGIYVTIYFSLRAVVTAALFVREHGATYLRALSVQDVISLLSDFVKDNYKPIANETLFKRLEGPFSDHVSDTVKDALALALANSALFRPSLETTLFPLVAIRVGEDFSCPSFFFRDPAGVLEEFPERLRRRLRPDSFPPVIDWEHRREQPSAWLGVRAHGLPSARKILRGILGAVALLPSYPYRYMFSGRQMWGGSWTLGGSMSFGEAVTPPIMEDIVLTSADYRWLGVLSQKIGAESRDVRRQMTALEYFYRAWPLTPSERFPILCMALDATYSERAGTTAAVVDGVQDTLGPLNAARLRDLLEIRGSVIHGGAPDVYDSRKYGRYYRRYGEDPIRDMGLLVAECLRRKVFEGALAEHEEPHQDIVEQARASGRLPRTPRTTSILNDCA